MLSFKHQSIWWWFVCDERSMKIGRGHYAFPLLELLRYVKNGFTRLDIGKMRISYKFFAWRALANLGLKHSLYFNVIGIRLTAVFFRIFLGVPLPFRGFRTGDSVWMGLEKHTRFLNTGPVEEPRLAVAWEKLAGTKSCLIACLAAPNWNGLSLDGLSGKTSHGFITFVATTFSLVTGFGPDASFCCVAVSVFSGGSSCHGNLIWRRDGGGVKGNISLDGFSWFTFSLHTTHLSGKLRSLIATCTVFTKHVRHTTCKTMSDTVQNTRKRKTGARE